MFNWRARMKIALIIITILAVVIGLIFITAKPAPSDNADSGEMAISWQNLSTNLQSESLLVDVRTAEEFSAGHIDGATLLPLADIQNGTLPRQDKSKPLYVYCRSGNRSAQAKYNLQKAGFTDVIDLGAMSSVVNLGGKTTK
jgi:phage shock protein E